MSASSNHLENKLLDHVLRGGSSDYANPGNVFLALFSGTASDVFLRQEQNPSQAQATGVTTRSTTRVIPESN